MGADFTQADRVRPGRKEGLRRDNGAFGTLPRSPIINAPQAAILSRLKQVIETQDWPAEISKQ